MLIQMTMHIKAIPQQMRLMSPPLPETFKLRLLKIIQQNRPILGMRTLINNNARTLLGRQATHIREPDLSNNNIEIMLRLVNMRAHRHDARHARGVRLRRPRRGRVHDAVLRGPQEVRRSAQPIQHAAAHDARAVRVGIDVDLHGRVHADDAQTADDLGAIRHLLRAQEQLGRVLVPPVVEAVEAVWREADRGRGREVQVAAVEQVQERVLQDFGPDFEVFEVGAAGLGGVSAGLG